MVTPGWVPAPEIVRVTLTELPGQLVTEVVRLEVPGTLPRTKFIGEPLQVILKVGVMTLTVTVSDAGVLPLAP